MPSRAKPPAPTANVEVKVRLRSIGPLRPRLLSLGAAGPCTLRQTDTYYVVPHGRLKVRIEDGDAGARLELIGYQRRDASVRTSRYSVVELASGEEAPLSRALGHALPERIVVRKRRELWMLNRDRVHLDRVERLGSFLEIEAYVGRGRKFDTKAGRRRTEHLLQQLGIADLERISGSYSDLLEALA